MGVMNCEMTIPPIEGLKDGAMSVGRHVLLNCKSDAPISPSQFDFTKAQFKLSEAETNKLKLFTVLTDAPKEAVSGGELQVSQAAIDMTFYYTGPQNISQLVLTDGVNELQLAGPSLNVESVIQPSQDGKPPEPFGPIAPIPISIPAAYFMYAVGVIVLFLAYSIFKAQRLAYYRRLKNKLAQYTSPTAPDTQFYKAIRSAEKKNYPLADLEKAFKLYNLRAYSLPMFDLTNEKVIRYFKRNYPQCKITRLHLQKFLGDFEELNKKSANLSLEEKNELVKRMYRYVESHKGLNL